MADERSFLNSLARAQQLISDPKFNRDVERRAKGGRKGINESAYGDDEIANFDAMVFGVGTSAQPQQQVRVPQQPRDMRNSKLPKEVLESFAETPTPEAYFDDGVSRVGSIVNNSMQPINEVAYGQQRQYTPQYAPQQGGGIDYNYIKYLIKEAIAESGRNLNEGANLSGMRGMCLGEGNTIQFLDKKGNVYEGKLVLKKRGNK